MYTFIRGVPAFDSIFPRVETDNAFPTPNPLDHALTEDGADAAQVLLHLRQQEEAQRRLRALEE